MLYYPHTVTVGNLDVYLYYSTGRFNWSRDSYFTEKTQKPVSARYYTYL